jgi:hypothetical protein
MVTPAQTPFSWVPDEPTPYKSRELGVSQKIDAITHPSSEKGRFNEKLSIPYYLPAYYAGIFS